MPRGYWLVKSEPFKYSWDQFVDDGSTYWDGVRNYEARNNLRAMRVGDLVLYYHSNEGKEVVGVARVIAESYPDPTIDDDTWVVVDLEPVQRLEKPVTLADVKADRALSEMALVKRGRISVVPVSAAEFRHVLELGATVLRRGAVPEKLPPREPPKRNPSARRAAAGKARSTGAKRRAKKKSASQKASAGKSVVATTGGRKVVAKKSTPTARGGRSR